MYYEVLAAQYIYIFVSFSTIAHAANSQVLNVDFGVAYTFFVCAWLSTIIDCIYM